MSIQSTGNEAAASAVRGERVSLLGEPYYRIANHDAMAPFFMSVVSSSDHWLFLSSTGGLTAGRVDADSALFPYYTDDKVAENVGNTGPLALFRVGQVLWEPFAGRRAPSAARRSLYKSLAGDKVVFEEVNEALSLTFRYAWRTSDRFGFVRTAWLSNDGAAPQRVEVLDGLQNLLPYGANSGLTTALSNLLDAYKRSEVVPDTSLAIFSLNASLSDLAEPSESLKATSVWQVGLDRPSVLLSSEQVEGFRHGGNVGGESDVRGRRGAYILNTTLDMAPGETREWSIVADVNQDAVAVERSLAVLTQAPAAIKAAIEDDIARSSAELLAIVASADGLQDSADEDATARHFANVLFNTMRGGIFADGYVVDRADLLAFLRVRNRRAIEEHEAFLRDLPKQLAVGELLEHARASGSPELERLCTSYLPLTFSRRHGDPSRPWNRFAIKVRKPDGSRNLDYQGNWRDIFQNWEALAYSYPAFLPGMVATFLNATTADGYNPYRVTRAGIEWEKPDPHDPWANIGYWSDHQVIYLLKLLEASERFRPGELTVWLDRPLFSHANVPYRIRSYAETVEDWSNTIHFDAALDQAITRQEGEFGTDARLLRDGDGRVFHVSLTEKLLSLLLAKVTNLVPEGGIWMNTQRPEWNDANNALVGKGLSVVTTAYLRRFLDFWRSLIEAGPAQDFAVGRDLAAYLKQAERVLRQHAPSLEEGFSDEARRAVMDALGAASSQYRESLYSGGPSAERESLARGDLLDFLSLAQEYVEQTLRANKRDDGLYHSYNTLSLSQGRAGIDRLEEMLEGQVAVLSSGMLSLEEAAGLVATLRASRLYRADQHSYILYPNREVKRFLDKNRVPAAAVSGSRLVQALEEAGDLRLLVRSLSGDYHFNGSFRNARDLQRALGELAGDPRFMDQVAAERDFILDLFERTFNHRAFTGRSSTFFAYEGLGSIYWHMVAKLLLAVQEAALAAGPEHPARPDLARAYYDVREGLSFNKTPAEYGAFPSDPYSHTPAGQGAKQPGMTGQVKEEVLTRLGEVGVRVHDGILSLDGSLLSRQEFTGEPTVFRYLDVGGAWQEIALPPGSVAFTLCQVPFVCTIAEEESIEIAFADGSLRRLPGLSLDASASGALFRRDGTIRQVRVAYRRLLDA